MAAMGRRDVRVRELTILRSSRHKGLKRIRKYKMASSYQEGRLQLIRWQHSNSIYWWRTYQRKVVYSIQWLKPTFKITPLKVLNRTQNIRKTTTQILRQHSVSFKMMMRRRKFRSQTTMTMNMRVRTLKEITKITMQRWGSTRTQSNSLCSNIRMESL